MVEAPTPKELPLRQLGEDFYPFPGGKTERYKGGRTLISPEFYLEGIGKGHVTLETKLYDEEIESEEVEYTAKILRQNVGENKFDLENVEEIHEVWPSIEYESLDKNYPSLRCVLRVGNIQLVCNDEVLRGYVSDPGEFDRARFGDWQTPEGEGILLFVPTSLLKYIKIRFEEIPLNPPH